jgi:P27 family predicted phage terminase small subunit
MPRRKLPAAIKELKGTARPNRMHPHPSLPPLSECPPLPSGVQLGKIGTQVWWETLTRLTALRVVTDNDLRPLAAYCAAVENWEEAQRSIREDGIIIQAMTTAGIVPKRNPAVDIASQQYTIMKDGMARFGLTPSDRQSIQALPDQEPEGDEWGLD